MNVILSAFQIAEKAHILDNHTTVIIASHSTLFHSSLVPLLLDRHGGILSKRTAIIVLSSNTIEWTNGVTLQLAANESDLHSATRLVNRLMKTRYSSRSLRRLTLRSYVHELTETSTAGYFLKNHCQVLEDVTISKTGDFDVEKYLSHLRGSLRSLSFLDFRVTNCETLAKFSHLRELNLTHLTRFSDEDLSSIEFLPNLATLSLIRLDLITESGLEVIFDPDSDALCRTLRSLTINYCRRISDFSSIRHLGNLEALSLLTQLLLDKIKLVPLEENDVIFFSNRKRFFPRLRELEIDTPIEHIEMLIDLCSLEKLKVAMSMQRGEDTSLYWLTNVSTLNNSERGNDWNMRSLQLDFVTVDKKNLETIGQNMKKLHNLKLTYINGSFDALDPTSWSGLSESLEELTITSSYNIRSARFISCLKNLRKCSIRSPTKIADLDDIVDKLPKLYEFYTRNSVANIDARVGVVVENDLIENMKALLKNVIPIAAVAWAVSQIWSAVK
jgi:hypothetical protein